MTVFLAVIVCKFLRGLGGGDDDIDELNRERKNDCQKEVRNKGRKVGTSKEDRMKGGCKGRQKKGWMEERKEEWKQEGKRKEKTKKVFGNSFSLS